MCDIANNLLIKMQPLVANIEHDFNNLQDVKKSLDDITAIKEYLIQGNEMLFKIGTSRLSSYLEKFHSTVSEYDANKYILQTNVYEVRNLPQYALAKEYLEKFCKFLLTEYNDTLHNYQDLKKDYDEKEIVNKYVNMLQEGSLFVDNIEEIKILIDVLSLNEYERNNLLIYVLKENSKVYNKSKKNDNFEDDEKKEVLEVIKKNQHLKNSEYNDLLDAVSEYVDLNKDIYEIINYDLLEKINISNILLAKKVSLYRKICFLYDNMNCRKCNKLFNEYLVVDKLYERTKGIKNQKEVIRIVKGEC